MENEKKTEELEKVEEEKVEEVTPTEEKPVEAEPISYSAKELENIEESRKEFLKVYRTQNTIKWIVSFVAIGAIIFGCIVVPNLGLGNTGLVVMIVTLVAALAATVLYTVFARKYINKKMHAYFDYFYENTNKYVFGDTVKDIKMPFPGKIQDEAFLDNNLYKDVASVGSRGLTEFVYEDVPVAVADCAGQVRKDKRLYPCFVGKYVYAASNYKYDEPLYIYFKGDKRALAPTNLEGVNGVLEDKKMIVYSNNKDWKKVLTADVKKILSSINMNKELVDLAISLQKGRLFVCMGYDDPLMVLPLQNQFDPKPTELYKKDVAKVLKLVKELNK